MSRADNDRLGDIIRAGRRLAAIVACGRDAFDQDWTLRDAAAHQIEIVVDAYTKLNADTQTQFGDVPVDEMTGMRVLLAHMYWQVDAGIVWETMASDIPGIVESAANAHQPPESGPTVHDEHVAIPRWQTPATSNPIEDSSGSLGSLGSGSTESSLNPANPPPARVLGADLPPPEQLLPRRGGLLARLFRRAASTSPESCGRPTASGTPCRQRRPAKIGDTCPAGHKRIA